MNFLPVCLHSFSHSIMYLLPLLFIYFLVSRLQSHVLFSSYLRPSLPSRHFSSLCSSEAFLSYFVGPSDILNDVLPNIIRVRAPLKMAHQSTVFHRKKEPFLSACSCPHSWTLQLVTDVQLGRSRVPLSSVTKG